MTVWHERVARTPEGEGALRVGALLAWFDTARAVVAYNGATFDMQVLRRYYNGDTARWWRHCEKLRDPMRAVRQAAGRRVKLGRLLALNAIGGKGGAGCDAPRLWEEGKHQQLERYCARDTHALAELVMKPHIAVARATRTAEASIGPILRTRSKREREGAEGGEGEDHGDGRRRRQEGGGEESGSDSGGESDEGDSEGNSGEEEGEGGGNEGGGSGGAGQAGGGPSRQLMTDISVVQWLLRQPATVSNMKDMLWEVIRHAERPPAREQMKAAVLDAWEEVLRGGRRVEDKRQDLVIGDVRDRVERLRERLEARAALAWEAAETTEATGGERAGG